MTNEPPDHSASTCSRYRVYLIGEDKRVGQAIDIAADTDEDAIAQVHELHRIYEAELWDRSRLVIRLPTLTRR